MRTALVITGAPRTFEPLIEAFIERTIGERSEFSNIRDLIFIRQRGAEEALGHANRLMPPGEQYDVRDALRATAHLESRRHNAHHCFLIGSTTCNALPAQLHECKDRVRREQQEVRDWNFFGDNIASAFLIPNNIIVPVF